MRTQGNYLISDSAIIGENVKIGNNAIIHDNVIIGDNSIICENCIIGEPCADSYWNSNYVNPKTIIGSNSLIRSNSVIYADSIFGDYFTTGNMVSIREKSIFGKRCIVGTFSDIQGNVRFGDYCRINSHAQIASKCSFGHFVFIYPMVVFTNDLLPPSNNIIGTSVGDFSQIATGSVILPGLTIGKHCLIGAKSLLTKNAQDFDFYSGNPAVRIGKVSHIWSKESKRPHYPWPYNYDRNLPWSGVGFEEWRQTEEGMIYTSKE